MDDSEQQFYRGMQKAVSSAVLGGAIIDQKPAVAPPNVQSTNMAFSILPIAVLLLGGGFDMGLPSFFSLGCSIFFAAYCGILLHYAPADNWLDNFIIIISHPFYWVLTIAALLNAMKRMAFAQMGWLKSNHQPYH